MTVFEMAQKVGYLNHEGDNNAPMLSLAETDRRQTHQLVAMA